MTGVDEILAGYDGIQAAQEAFYKDLHEHPELSHHEHRTAQCVAGEPRWPGSRRTDDFNHWRFQPLAISTRSSLKRRHESKGAHDH